MKKQMRLIEEKNQEEFMKKLLDMLENLEEKAVKKSYIPTDDEREMFRQVCNIIYGMRDWF